MKSVVITGANGFLGSSVVNALSEEGIDVTCVVRSPESDVSRINVRPDVRFVYCDKMEYGNLADKLKDRDYDVFYHFAWEGCSGASRGDYRLQTDNVVSTCDAVTLCGEIGCRRFVFASSIMEYEAIEQVETDCKLPRSLIYNSAKISADYMARALADSFGIDYMRALISNIYGPGERSPRLINSSIRKFLKGEHCSFSSGTQLYDFIYIDDAVKAFVLIGEKGNPRRTYYIGNESPRPLSEFLLELRDIVAPEADSGLGEIAQSGLPSLSYDEFDLMALREDTGFETTVSFAEGIRRTRDWIASEENG